MNNKIGIGIITCDRVNFFKQAIESIPSVDEIVVVNDGKPYDNDRWGAYYRPYGLSAPDGETVTETSTLNVAAANKTVAEDTESEPAHVSEPVVVPKATSSDKAQDILAMIRARQKG